MTDRLYPDRPFVGVGVVVRREGLVLLVRRARPPREGQWALPGGAQELGEPLFETARREVFEETGLAVEPYAIVTALDLIERDGDRVRYHYTLVEIAARCGAGGDLHPGDDVSEAAWVRPEDIPALDAWEEVARIVRLAEEA